MKLIQEFVKTRYSKLSRQVKEVSRLTGMPVKDGAVTKESNQSKDKIKANAKSIAEQATLKGTVVEVVEEALKWRLEAQSKKTKEFFNELSDNVGHYRRAFEVLSNETATEFTQIKESVVDVSAEVLMQVKDTMLPAYEQQVLA